MTPFISILQGTILTVTETTWLANTTRLRCSVRTSLKTKVFTYQGVNTVYALFYHQYQQMDNKETGCRSHHMNIYRYMWNNLRVIDFGNPLAWLGFNQGVTCIHATFSKGVILPLNYRNSVSGPSCVSHIHVPQYFAFLENKNLSLLLIEEGCGWRSWDGFVLKIVQGLVRSQAIEYLPEHLYLLHNFSKKLQLIQILQPNKASENITEK